MTSQEGLIESPLTASPNRFISSLSHEFCSSTGSM